MTGTSNGNIYIYDQNGNQTSRRVGGTTYTLIYNAENRLVQVKLGRTIQATYTYDGDGNRVKTVVGSTTTAFVGNFLEWTGSTTSMKKYYYASGQRVAMRQGSSTLYYLLTDHLGSTSITATSGGGFYTELRYYPWGGTRYASGTTPTSFRYTGQREAEVGLYYYGSRFYDPSVGRFIQADTIIPNPGNPASFDRYAYVRNNPIKYIDPTGHWDTLPDWEQGMATSPVHPIASLQVALASGINQNEPQAQYIQVGGIWHYKLCGQVALAMIARTIGIPASIRNIAQNDGIGPGDGTDSADLYNVWSSLCPGSTFTVYAGRNRTTYTPIGSPTQELNGQAWVNSDNVMNFMANELMNGNYLILGIYLNTSGSGTIVGNGSGAVGHWVVVTAVYSNYVEINDPFCNCVRRVDRSVIEEAIDNFGHLIAIEPPPPPQQTTYDGRQ